MSDLINRSEALKEIFNRYSSAYEWCIKNGISGKEIEMALTSYAACHVAIKRIPSVEPKNRMDQNKHIGKWEERSVFEGGIQQWQSARCSVCDKYHTTPYLYYFDNYNYCPNCGAKMEVTE